MSVEVSGTWRLSVNKLYGELAADSEVDPVWVSCAYDKLDRVKNSSKVEVFMESPKRVLGYKN